jgi:NAD(P)-dependent dehydrogenase (short-subunit alcohol dehydrogenase family)
LGVGAGNRKVLDFAKAASRKTEGPQYIIFEVENPPFGYVWTEAALARGDRVAAAARNIASLDGLKEKYGDKLLLLSLDVGDKKAVDAAVEKAHEQFGPLDIVINNAGYGLFGAIEEVSEAEARAQIENNLFGALWVTQATLPRSHRSRP